MTQHDDIMEQLAVLGRPAVVQVPDLPPETLVIVGFQVRAGSQLAAQTALVGPLYRLVRDTSDVLSWWIAEDERYDGNTRESAVLCKQGVQRTSQRLLVRHNLAKASSELRN